MATLATLPAVAKIVELQLSVRSAIETPRRPLNRSRAPAASFREMWKGQVAFAPACLADARELAAFFEGRDGRVSAWGLPLKQGYATHANTFLGTLAATTAAGADVLSVTRTSGTAALLPGTLLAIGTAGDDTSQIVEVLDAVTIGTATAVSIAPRLRDARSGGVAVTGGDVLMPVRLAGDDVPIDATATYGVTTIGVVEAIT